MRQIRFLDNKNQEFIWQMLPLFSQMKVYKDDALYGQNDPAEEVFFIIKGRVKQYYNIFCQRPDKDAQYLPVNVVTEGSYFGDIEVILNQGRDVRKTMTVAKVESQLLVVTKVRLLPLLASFPNVLKEMKHVASRRLSCISRSIELIKQEYLGVINEQGDAMAEFAEGFTNNDG